jgi:hypothetical protein
MRHGRRSSMAAHPWDHTVGAGGDSSLDRCEERLAPGPTRRASCEPQPLRELLKPMVEELQDTLERFEGQPTPADYRWLRGQLRRLAPRLGPLNG